MMEDLSLRTFKAKSVCRIHIGEARCITQAIIQMIQEEKEKCSLGLKEFSCLKNLHLIFMGIEFTWQLLVYCSVYTQIFKCI